MSAANAHCIEKVALSGGRICNQTGCTVRGRMFVDMHIQHIRKSLKSMNFSSDQLLIKVLVQ